MSLVEESCIHLKGIHTVYGDKANANDHIAANVTCLKLEDLKKRLHKRAREELNEQLIQS